MSIILNIETATTVCSVSVAKNGEIITLKEVNNGYTHAENLHVFINDILKEANVTPTQLNAIAVSKGPGSYTGLRIGVSAAKGFAYALNIPLIGIDTLATMTQQALDKSKAKGFFYPMLDARRMEVYTACYNESLEIISPVEAFIVDENSVKQLVKQGPIYFFGDGMPKCKELLNTVQGSNFIDDIYPSAKEMAKLSYNKFTKNVFEDVAYFEPFYLKEFLITSKKT